MGCDADLGAYVAELRCYAEEEFVLPAHGFIHKSRETGALLGLEGHVCVCDFGDGREEKDNGQKENEGCDAEVGPLHADQLGGVCFLEEDTGGEEGGHYGADGLEGLGELETELGEAWGTAGCDERVRGCFEGGEAAADDEEGAAKASEGAVDSGGPEHEGADAVDAETSDEGPSIAEFAHDPTGVGWWADEVGAEVGTLEPAGLGGRNIEGVLEFGI